MQVLVAGATGFVGSRLTSGLVDDHDVRVLARDPKAAPAEAEAHPVDLLDGDGLGPALDGVDVAYYLVHSLGVDDFADRDEAMAANFAEAARDADVDHVVYLGGLVPREGPISGHLASRRDVGRILRETVPTTELRAGPIIGTGSGSWEMVRYLVDRLPVMVAPKWIDNEVTPIHIDDVACYLRAVLDAEPSGVVEIGGADDVTFREMMQTYARVTGRRRWIVKVPLLVPSVAALWVGLVTPIPNALAVPLIEGITSTVTADRAEAEKRFPDVDPISYEAAVRAVIDDRSPS